MIGRTDVEIAPYDVIKSDTDQKIELRHYESLVLVSAPMGGNVDEGRNTAFSKLFSYISGDNTARSKIAMTAPVFIDDKTSTDGIKIPMTAPVFMDDTSSQAIMSFVLPASYTIETAPLPQDPSVKLHEIKDYNVATIQFNGLLRRSNIDKHQSILETWIENEGYEIIGPRKTAGYNPPFTLPALRRNEVLIPIEVQ